MKDRVFGVFQRVGRSFMFPIAVPPVAGLLLGIGSSSTNETTIAAYGLQGISGSGTMLNAPLVIMSRAGGVIFDNLPVIFMVGVAIGMAKAEKEVTALSAMIAFLVMHVSINGVLTITGKVLSDRSVAADVLEGTVTSAFGMQTLQMGVFRSIIIGLGVAMLHNRYHKIVLPSVPSFFGGSRFIPIISTVVYMGAGVFMYFIWPTVQNGIYALGGLVTGTDYLGTLIFGIVKRSLTPLGLHHVLYMPFWQTAVGGTMVVDGNLIQGGQSIFLAQLVSLDMVYFSADATRYFSDEFISMTFGLPGAVPAMYRCTKPERKKVAGGLLLSTALTCMLTGITEPIEFSFLFVTSIPFVVQVVLAGSVYTIAHILNIAVGLASSGGFLDLLIFGILQGDVKTSWIRILPVGTIYFLLYYFIFSFLIKKFDLRTPGREKEDEETELYIRVDANARKSAGAGDGGEAGEDEDQASAAIAKGLGRVGNIISVDCCVIRLRCSVDTPELANEKLLKAIGAMGVIKRGRGIQVIYGPNVTVIKANLEHHLEHALKIKETALYGGNENNSGKDSVKHDREGGSPSQTPGVGPDQGNIPHTGRRILLSPFNGTATLTTEAPDEVFASRAVGDGYMVISLDGQMVAPKDCRVVFVLPSKHATGLRSARGTEYLIHVGMDMVELDGRGSETFVTDGQKVEKGHKLVEFDLESIRKHAASDACMTVFTGLKEGQETHMEKAGDVKTLEEIVWY